MPESQAATATGDVAQADPLPGQEATEGMWRAIMQSLSSAEFIETLRAAVPTVGPILDEHLDEHDGLLIHLLLPDLLRFAAGRFADGDVSTSRRVLDVVARALTEGDDQLINAVAVSFVENIGAHPDETPEFVVTWPPALLAEHREQQSS